jgi:alkyl hydroperoxide reductase subunit D
MTLEQLREQLPEYARDLKVNLQTVLQAETLSAAQRWGVAVAAAATVGNVRLRDALIDEARKEVGGGVVEDALAAVALMGMNNIFYRFRHLVGKPEYAQKPARLRMTRIAKPATTKLDFELFCLVVSAITGCEVCVQAHEKVATETGLSQDAVHDAIRIAATVRGAAVALDLPPLSPALLPQGEGRSNAA